MNWFNRIAAILGIVLQVVPLIERIFKGITGPEKKQVATNLINQTLSDSGASSDSGTAEIITKTIDSVVENLNRIGVFKHAAETVEENPKKKGEKGQKQK